eukprot:2732359-Rhodomonas_salina.1
MPSTSLASSHSVGHDPTQASVYPDSFILSFHAPTYTRLFPSGLMPNALSLGHEYSCVAPRDCFILVLEFGIRTGDVGSGMH